MPSSPFADPDAEWQPRLALGVTGHRATNPAFSANSAAITDALAGLFARIEGIAAGLRGKQGAVRLHSLLVDGTDQVAGELALARGWELVVPMPFGADLNLAINAHPTTPADAAALCRGQPAADPQVEAHAAAIRSITARAHLFELADRDAQIETLLLATLTNPQDRDAARSYEALVSGNVALAGRVMIERTDLVVAVWDGKIANLPGGTGHTIINALEMGTPVLLIDPTAPQEWSILTRPEELGHPERNNAPDAVRQARLEATIRAAMVAQGWHPQGPRREQWRARSSFAFSLYRLIERVFGEGTLIPGRMRIEYEAPDAISTGSAGGG